MQVKSRQQILEHAPLVWSIYAILTDQSWEAGKNRKGREWQDKERNGGCASVQCLLWAFNLSNPVGRRDNQGESLANRADDLGFITGWCSAGGDPTGTAGRAVLAQGAAAPGSKAGSATSRAQQALGAAHVSLSC